MKIIHSDGTVTYYYYKKKVGRRRKPGPRKKMKKRGRRWQEPWDFKILKFNHKKQSAYIGVFHDTQEVEYAKEQLLKDNQKVVFPKKYISNGRKNRQVYEAESEYVILKKIRDAEKETGITKLRNQYGTFVEHKTTSENWAIYDKFPCLEEETLWVYGFNPKTDRKTASWILDNLILDYAEEKSTAVIIYIMVNKLIIKYDEDFTFVICKNQSDAIRLYNFFEESTKRVRNVIFTGATSFRDWRGKDTVAKIMEKTGWDKKKICRSTTRT